MPFVKVPGTDREIWIDLHEPTGPETPWFVSAGHEVELTPEQFALEMSHTPAPLPITAPPGAHTGLGFIQTEQVLKVDYLNRESVGTRVRSALAYEKARRKIMGGHSGKPRAVFGFTNVEDFVQIVLYFESVGHKQAIRKTIERWRADRIDPPPSRRHIEITLNRARRWLIGDMHMLADLARKRLGMKPLPTKPPMRRTGSRTN